MVIGEFEGTEPNLPEPAKSAYVAEKIVPAANHTILEQSTVPDVPGRLMDDLSARGLMPSAVLKLLGSLSSDRLDIVEDYIDYWDKAKKTGDVGPGFLYDLIKNGDPLPTGFETRRQRASRLAADEQRKNAARIQERLKADYEKHTAQLIDRFIADLPPGDFESRAAAHKSETANQSGFWSERPELAEQFARHAARAEISKGVTLPPYEDFYRHEFPRVATELQLDPAELGIELGTPKTTIAEGESKDPRKLISPDNDVLPISGQFSSSSISISRP